MKKVLIAVFAFLVGMYNAAAQTVTRKGDTFVVESHAADSIAKTKFFFRTKTGEKLPIYITKKGACFVIRTSKKSGKEYRQYLSNHKELVAQIHEELKFKPEK